MRAKKGSIHLNRRKKVLKRAKGFRGGRRRLFRTAISAVKKAGLHAFASRRQKKREMRRLWIVRINAATRPHGLSYSRFMNNLKKSGVELDRKTLAMMALSDPAGFGKLVAETK